ncbi:response regulator [Pseudomonas sp.]|uniref:response regulator n=1 Tax=Pseudomonas sp. TaxID=306 RepID=UPI0026359244|nr:response regulator [Pseudomonas sp.]
MSKVSVLVVDDASFIRDLIKNGLRNAFPGIRIEDAINGRKAQNLLTREAFDLVLCDWEMPEMSGLELLAWCRGQDRLKALPFIMVTSRGDKENVVQAIQAGVSDFVSKPFTNEQLLTKVKKAFSKAGLLEAVMNSAPVRVNTALSNDSLNVLTGGKAQAVTTTRPASVAPTPAGRGQGQLRLPRGTQACVIKALSLKEALLVVRRGAVLPQVLDSAVLDLEQGENAEVARLNGYLHAIAAYEARPDSDWLQLTLRFVDQDIEKMNYLSRLIAQGTVHKHFVPGAG